MNLLYLHCHDAGRWIEPYDPRFSTPHLAEFSRSATVFRNAHCANPTCSPSRAALLTGQWAHRQMLGLAHRGFSLRDPSRHLGNFLKEQGYRTALCGVQHEFGTSWEGWPYQENRQPKNSNCHDFNYDTDVALLAVDFLESVQQDKPFFLSCGFFYPHREFPGNHGIDADRVGVPAIFPDVSEVRQDLADYQAAVREMDRAAGMVLDALDRQGLRGNTVVVFTTDHGPAFPYMKCTLRDAGTGVSLILRHPGSSQPRVIDALVSQVDVFPTLCDLLDLPHPGWLEGVGLVPLLSGETDAVRSELFAEVNFHAAYEPKRSIRTARHKLILNLDEKHPGFPPSNIDPGPTKSFLFRHGLADLPRPPLEFYDLFLDPAEKHNLAGHPGHAEQVGLLLERLNIWREQTADPLLTGPLAPPDGAVVTPHEQLDY